LRDAILLYSLLRPSTCTSVRHFNCEIMWEYCCDCWVVININICQIRGLNCLTFSLLFSVVKMFYIVGAQMAECVGAMGFVAYDVVFCVGARGFVSRPWQYTKMSFSSSQLARFSHPKMPPVLNLFRMKLVGKHVNNCNSVHYY
jgi:hypothetical protein